MSENSLKQTLKKIEYTARWMGIALEKKEGIVYKYHLLYIFNFIWLNTDAFGAICWFIKGAQMGESLTTLTYVAPCITLSILADAKSLSLIIYKDHMHKLISILKDLEGVQNARPESVERSEIIRNETKFLNLILKVLNLLNWALLIMFPLMPLTLTMLSYIKHQVYNPLLPFLIVYPFDAYDIRFYPFVFLRQIWSEIIVVLSVGGADFIFFICSTFIRIQFRLLAHDIERLIDGQVRTDITDPRYSDKFLNIIKWHQQIIHAVELLETIYSKSTLFNFVFSSALICLTGFNVTAIGDFAFVVSFLSFLFMSLFQIYFLCFFGDMLMRASVTVTDAAYNSKWYLTDKNTAKKLLIILMRAQKPCKLTAFGFADVNLIAFTKILSTSWSYFALLNTVYRNR